MEIKSQTCLFRPENPLMKGGSTPHLFVTRDDFGAGVEMVGHHAHGLHWCLILRTSEGVVFIDPLSGCFHGQGELVIGSEKYGHHPTGCQVGAVLHSFGSDLDEANP